jgi:putative spermidine/putrescine transport system permease protein
VIDGAALRRLSRFFSAHPRLGLALLLAPPLGWLGIVYVGSLVGLLVQSFFAVDAYTGQVVRRLTLRTYGELFTASNLDIVGRTVAMAAAVTVACAVLAFPLAYYMARYARGRVRALVYLGVLLPLWSSYLVRVYSWKLILAREGILSWVLARIGAAPLLERLLA